jgi:hypothetical protein
MNVLKYRVTYECKKTLGNEKSSIEPVQTPLIRRSSSNNYCNNKDGPNVTCSILRIHSPHKSYRQTIVMLFVMMAIFFFCILPYRIFSIWAVFAETKDLQDLGIQNYYNILTISRIMFYINSMVNPILYHFLSKKFQAAFKRSLCGCFL